MKLRLIINLTTNNTYSTQTTAIVSVCFRRSTNSITDEWRERHNSVASLVKPDVRYAQVSKGPIIRLCLGNIDCHSDTPKTEIQLSEMLLITIAMFGIQVHKEHIMYTFTISQRSWPNRKKQTHSETCQKQNESTKK